jgi:hypothetical protein
MDGKLFNGLILTGLTCLIPNLAEAQMFSPVAANCVITRPRAVMSTQYQTQQVTTYRDVAETAYCQKQVVENVPITTCKDVTTDEGGYQMVWVPKPVTRQVAQTVIQQQVKTVSVPVQTVRRVPQISTQVVPIQTVRYVEETVPVQMTAFAGSCSTCGQSIGSSVFAPQMSYAPTLNNIGPYPSVPAASTAAIPSMPPIAIPSSQTAYAPTPAYTPQAVPARSAPEPYETVPARGVPAPRDEAVTPVRKTSMFQSVPSAARVWQSQATPR